MRLASKGDQELGPLQQRKTAVGDAMKNKKEFEASNDTAASAIQH